MMVTLQYFFMRQDRPKFSAQERYVPSSAGSRALHFGMLGIQLLGGTVSEAIKQKVGLKDELNDQKGKEGFARYAINEKNADRLQKSFRKMRGAALKVGQILSTSENSVLPPIIRDAMEKARSEADIMPVKQVVRLLEKAHGKDWQKHFREINLFPFAAASIGQVHEATLKDGQKVALKIQYNGVANSIDSDLDNFKRLIDMFGVFPKGLYLNEMIRVTRGELKWECDYLREAAI
jgi:aarF domain-containing kinase